MSDIGSASIIVHYLTPPQRPGWLRRDRHSTSCLKNLQTASMHRTWPSSSPYTSLHTYVAFCGIVSTFESVVYCVGAVTYRPCHCVYPFRFGAVALNLATGWHLDKYISSHLFLLSACASPEITSQITYKVYLVNLPSKIRNVSAFQPDQPRSHPPRRRCPSEGVSLSSLDRLIRTRF